MIIPLPEHTERQSALAETPWFYATCHAQVKQFHEKHAHPCVDFSTRSPQASSMDIRGDDRLDVQPPVPVGM
jgi:hypothetical protein